MGKIYAFVTTQGTAMAETAICDTCSPKYLIQAPQAEDWDHQSLVDCTGNDALTCQYCATDTFRIDDDGECWIGHKSYPEAYAIQNSDLAYAIRGRPLDYVYRGRHFSVPTTRGYSVSMSWGSGTYSSNHDMFENDQPFVDHCPDAEIAVFDTDGKLVDWCNNGQIRGWCRPQLARLIINKLNEEGLDGLVSFMEAFEGPPEPANMHEEDFDEDVLD